MQHEADIEYFDRLARLTFQLAESEGVKVSVIEPKRRPSTGYGNAYLSEQRICISVRDKHRVSDGGEWASSRYRHEFNLNTFAHELAHLKEFQQYGDTNHGARFKAICADLEQKLIRLDLTN